MYAVFATIKHSHIMFLISHNVRILAFVTFVGFVHSVGTKLTCSIFINKLTGDHKRLFLSIYKQETTKGCSRIIRIKRSLLIEHLEENATDSCNCTIMYRISLSGRHPIDQHIVHTQHDNRFNVFRIINYSG